MCLFEKEEFGHPQLNVEHPYTIADTCPLDHVCHIYKLEFFVKIKWEGNYYFSCLLYASEVTPCVYTSQNLITNAYKHYNTWLVSHFRHFLEKVFSLSYQFVHVLKTVWYLSVSRFRSKSYKNSFILVFDDFWKRHSDVNVFGSMLGLLACVIITFKVSWWKGELDFKVKRHWVWHYICF